MMKDLTPEQRLLVLLARSRLNTEQRDAVLKLLNASPRWEIVQEESEWLGTQPFLFKHFSKTPLGDFVPDALLESCRNAHRKTLLQNLRLYGQVRKILDCAHASSIPVILLKGIFLAREVYYDLALRPMKDIDILCREEDLPAIRITLNDLGFSLLHPARNLTHQRFNKRGQIGQDHHIPSRYHPRKGEIEVHFRLFPEKKITLSKDDYIEEPWATSLCGDFDGVPFSRLCEKWLLLHLLLHLVRHLNEPRTRLLWFTDIHETVCRYRYSIPWDEVLQTSDSFGRLAEVRSILRVVESGWKSPIPTGVLRGKVTARIGRHQATVPGLLSASSRPPASQSKIVRTPGGYLEEIFRTRELKRRGEKLSYFCGYIFPSEDWMIRKYEILDKQVTLGLRLHHAGGVLVRLVFQIARHVVRPVFGLSKERTSQPSAQERKITSHDETPSRRADTAIRVSTSGARSE